MNFNTNIIQPSFNGPADQGILIKNRGNNALLAGKMPMPQKFYPSASTSMFSKSTSTMLKLVGCSRGVFTTISINQDFKIALSRLGVCKRGKTY